jgi:hypothetical protein
MDDVLDASDSSLGGVVDGAGLRACLARDEPLSSIARAFDAARGAGVGTFSSRVALCVALDARRASAGDGDGDATATAATSPALSPEERVAALYCLATFDGGAMTTNPFATTLLDWPKRADASEEESRFATHLVTSGEAEEASASASDPREGGERWGGADAIARRTPRELLEGLRRERGAPVARASRERRDALLARGTGAAPAAALSLPPPRGGRLTPRGRVAWRGGGGEESTTTESTDVSDPALMPTQQADVLAALAAVPPDTVGRHAGLSPADFPALVEHNPNVAHEFLVLAMSASAARSNTSRNAEEGGVTTTTTAPPPAASAFLDTLVQMEMSLHSMEVVNRLTTSPEIKARSIHWSPYDRVGVVNAVP